MTILLILTGSLAECVTATWTGQENTDWCNSGNWSPTGIPNGVGDTANFDLGNSVPIPTINSCPAELVILGTLNVSDNAQTIGTPGAPSGTILLQAGGATAITLSAVPNPDTATNLNIESLIISAGNPLTVTTGTNTILNLSGSLNGAADMTKTGPGLFFLGSSKSSQYIGTVTVDEGDLRVFVSGDSPVLAGAATVDGGKLSVGGGRAISGLVTLTSGTISLIGENIFSSGFDFDGGLLTVEQGPVLLTTNTTLGGSVTIDTNTDHTLTMNGTITGAGSINKTGRNSLILSGTTTLPTTPITISDGTIAVNATLSALSFSVPSGGILGGTGPITAPVTLTGGTIAPGNSIDTLNIIGDVSFSSTSTLLSEITRTAGNSDLLNVTGMVTIVPGTTLLVDPNLGIYLPGSTYTVVTASGGYPTLSVFDTLEFTAPGFTGTLSQVGSSIILTLDQGSHVFLHLLTSGHNPEQVALCFNGQPIDTGGDFETVAIQLQPLDNSPKAMENALDQMQPAIFGSLNLIQESQMTLVQSTFSHRLQAWGNFAYGDVNPNSWNLWFKPVGEFSRQKSTGEQVGYNTQAYGGMIGTDRTFWKHLHLGLATGFVYNNVNWKRSRGRAHSYNVYGAAYAAWQRSHYELLASFVAGWNAYHGKRNIKFTTLDRIAKHNNHGYVLGLHLEGACSYIQDHTRLRPFGKFEYTYSTQDEYKESGASSLNLRVQRKSSDRIRADLGLDLSHSFKTNRGVVIPNVYVSGVYEKELRSGHMNAKFGSINCSMSLHALRPVRFLFAPGAGITGIFYSYHLSLGLRWDGEFGRRYTNQKVLMEATLGF